MIVIVAMSLRARQLCRGADTGVTGSAATGRLRRSDGNLVYAVAAADVSNGLSSASFPPSAVRIGMADTVSLGMKKDAKGCLAVALCSHQCQRWRDNSRGESWHEREGPKGDKLKSGISRDEFNPCHLGCCLRSASTYNECVDRCWKYAQVEHDRLERFAACKAGCDFRCRWVYDVKPDQDSCPSKHFAVFQKIFDGGLVAPEYKKLQRLLIQQKQGA